MCGIAGRLNFDKKPVSENALKEMSASLAHRGPDGKGLFMDGDFGMAHRRLAIFDLTEAALQPMKSGSERYIISFNGECYNYLELRSELVKEGCQFRTNSDTEVILEGIERHGLEFINKMNGMFAFSLWDSRDKTLYLCRDRLGIKPLYYSMNEKGLVFASEIKAILAAGDHKAAINDEALFWYLKLRYVPDAESLFKGILKLKPGCFMKIKPSGEISTHQYWDFLTKDHDLVKGSKDQSYEEVFELLKDAVQLRLRADIPVGSFLSAGIDSSALVGLAAQLGFQPETYTMNLNAGLDETKEAAAFSNSLGLSNQVVNFDNKGYEKLPQVIWHLEEPLGDSIIAPTYFLTEKAATKNKVVLSGEGADEIFGGYVHQLALPILNNIKASLPRWGAHAVSKGFDYFPAGIIDALSPYPAKIGAEACQRFKNYFKQAGHGAEVLNFISLFDDHSLEKLLLNKRHSAKNIFNDFWKTQKYSPFYNNLLRQDLSIWCTNYNLLRMDKLGMAHGLEVRVPFLDHRLVELCLRLPEKWMRQGREQKLALRKALQNKNIVPESIRKKKKTPFFLPVEKHWQHGLKAMIQDTLRSKAFKERGLFESSNIQQILEKKSLSTVEAKQIMSLFTFEIWCQQFID